MLSPDLGIVLLKKISESSSADRAPPCQGGGRGFEPRLPLCVARVVELVDTQDLKSCDHCDRAGSIPAPSTKERPQLIVYQFVGVFLFLHRQTFCKTLTHAEKKYSIHIKYAENNL